MMKGRGNPPDERTTTNKMTRADQIQMEFVRSVNTTQPGVRVVVSFSDNLDSNGDNTLLLQIGSDGAYVCAYLSQAQAVGFQGLLAALRDADLAFHGVKAISTEDIKFANEE